MYPSPNTFQYFPHSLLSKFFVSLDTQIGESQNVLSASEVNKPRRKHRKRMSDSLLQFFWENRSRPLSSSSSISSSLLVHFEWLKTWWVFQLWLHKTSFYLRGKYGTIKDFKLEIRPSSNTELLYTEHFISSPLLYQIEQILQRWRATNVLWASEGEEQCVRISFEFLSVHLPTHLP
jgi:hypothetical protein